MTALSVNLNKVALVRNTRHLGIPSVTRAAALCLQAGAQGITVHPRPDQRHIRTSDVAELSALLESWPGREFNIEGNPFHNLLEFIEQHRPDQATLVPDGEGQFTSDHGWNLLQDKQRLQPVIAQIKKMGVRVSLFMDPDPGQMQLARQIGADRIELYTEPYAQAHGTARQAEILANYIETARMAQQHGLAVNAGHDLNLSNLPAFLKAVPDVKEVSIGHALISDALEIGYENTVRAYLACCQAS